MRFMTIEAKVRLKNFEHIVDLIEQDGGEVRIANYNGNGKARPKKKRKTRTKVTPALKKEVRSLHKKLPGLSLREVGEKVGLSASSVHRIIRRKP